jgi:hypothetical protein
MTLDDLSAPAQSLTQLEVLHLPRLSGLATWWCGSNMTRLKELAVSLFGTPRFDEAEQEVLADMIMAAASSLRVLYLAGNKPTACMAASLEACEQLQELR